MLVKSEYHFLCMELALPAVLVLVQSRLQLELSPLLSVLSAQKSLKS